jgi:nicotinamidase-related amidase
MSRHKIPADLTEMIDPESAALLMWDFQVGLGGNATNLDQITESGNRLLAVADDVDVPVIWSRHTVPDLAQVTAGSLYRMMKKQGVSQASDLEPFMQEGSPEREFLSQIRPRPQDTIIDKSTPSFFIGTPLNLRLAALEIRSLLICGVATDIGVDLTAKHAFALGYFPVVVEDAVGSYTDERHRAGIEAMKSWIPTVDSPFVVDAWGSRT